jgi:hypothetical protein
VCAKVRIGKRPPRSTMRFSKKDLLPTKQRNINRASAVAELERWLPLSGGSPCGSSETLERVRNWVQPPLRFGAFRNS